MNVKFGIWETDIVFDYKLLVTVFDESDWKNEVFYDEIRVVTALKIETVNDIDFNSPYNAQGFLNRTKDLTTKGSSAVISRDRYGEFNLQMDPRTFAHNESLQLLPTQFIKNSS